MRDRLAIGDVAIQHSNQSWWWMQSNGDVDPKFNEHVLIARCIRSKGELRLGFDCPFSVHPLNDGVEIVEDPPEWVWPIIARIAMNVIDEGD